MAMAKAAEPNKIIYSMVRVGKTHGTRQVLRDISLSYFYGAKIGVLGLNGAGKSTLLRIMAGVERQFAGETHCAPGYTIGFLEQEPTLDAAKTVAETVREGVRDLADLLREFEEISARFAEPMSDDEMNALLEKQGKVQDKLDAAGAWDLDSRLEMAMDALRCPPGDTPVKVLSGGESRRVALCRLLLQKPDILLLDEPTNHLDAESVAWLEQHLQQYEGTVIAVTHDRYFLDNVAGWILELDRGYGIPWKGNYSSWLAQKRERLQREEKAETDRQRTLQRELEWIHMSPKGRHAKGKARISAYQELLQQPHETLARDLEIFIPPGPRLGDVVIRADGVAKGYHDRLLFERMTFSVPAGDGGDRGAQRRGEDHAVPPARGGGEARRGNAHAGPDGHAGLRGPGAKRSGPQRQRLGVHLRRPGPDRGGQGAGELPRLRRPLQFRRFGSAEEGRRALRGGAEPVTPGADAPP